MMPSHAQASPVSHEQSPKGYILPGSIPAKNRIVPRDLKKIYEGIKEQSLWAVHLAKLNSACAQTAAVIREATSGGVRKFRNLVKSARLLRDNYSTEIPQEMAMPGDLITWTVKEGVTAYTGHIQTITRVRGKGMFTVVEGHMGGKPNNRRLVIFPFAKNWGQGPFTFWSDLLFHSFRRWN